MKGERDMGIAENVMRVRERIDRAANGRQVLLVAASKMNDAERVRQAVAAGVDACGENRVQELVEKRAAGAYAGAPLHFIGHLQRNKIKYLVGQGVDLIESVDSAELLHDIDARASKLGVTQDVLIEVNIAGELSKSGVEPEKLEELLNYAAGLSALRVRGLMSIPPISETPGANRPYFAKMRELFVDIGRKKYDNTSMDLLSMGMSGDFEDAIAEGANMVRVGSAIFGARDYGAKH